MSSGEQRQAVFARLRGQLDAWGGRAAPGPAAVLGTGLAGVDEALGGGLPRGALTELVCAAPSCGGQLFLGHLLAVARQARQRVALVDAADAFDPTSHEPDLLRHLVWVRGGGVAAALQAADLVVRDANFGLVVLDLRDADARELRRVPATTWYRLQRAVEPTALVLLIVTVRPTAPSAQVRLELASAFTASAFVSERGALLARLAPAVQRQRVRVARENTAG